MTSKRIFLITLGLIILIILAFSLPLAFGFGKTGKNIHVLGKDYSLLNKKEIVSRLQTDFPLPAAITLKNFNQEFTLNLSSISATVDTNNVASNLLFRRLKKGLINYFKDFFQPQNFPLEVNYDSAALDQNLAQIASQIDKSFIFSELSLDSKTNTVMVKDGQLGQKTDTGSLRQSIITALQNYQLSSTIEIPISSIGSLPQASEISAAKQLASKLIGKSLILNVPDQSITLTDTTLISWINFQNSCRTDSVQEYVNGLNTSLKKDPINAVFKFENGKVLDFQAAANGYTLNDPGLADRICSNLIKLTENSDKNTKIDIITTSLAPQITTGDANDLGIKELIGSGSSTFKHSDATRNYNVQKGASIINRILVAPGDTFSFIKNLGEVSVATGYKNAYIIKEGQTILDAGGGICQVSTTLFRAMLNAGLNITARTNHAYRVIYYEEDMPPGYDATVFIPSPDLKFINDTGHYVLIQSTYDGVNKKLTYHIYGTSDGRKVNISNYHQWDATPAPPDVYIDDPTLPMGKIVQDEHRIPGLKTAFDWKVTAPDGTILHQKTFQSVFVPWAAVYRRGTGN
jgi:vancomycin resistance protein YoaR